MKNKQMKIFLASSNELKPDREKFEREIARKNNLWLDKNVSLQLVIWEDLSARMSPTRSQDEYNQKIKEADLFVLLAYIKVGMYTEEEFETAFGSFQKTEKPFIFTYFKNIETEQEDSLEAFKNKLEELGHFYSPYSSFDNLWNQFNKELDRLILSDFEINDREQSPGSIVDNREAAIKNQSINTNFINTINNYGDKKIPKVLGDIPASPSLFIGRDNLTKDIFQKLNGNNNLLLLVNGKGGIGKTTIASQYYFENIDFYVHLIWLVSEKGIKEAIISLAFSLQMSFPDNLSQEQQLIEIIRCISDLKRPVLLIIDNANDINDLGDNSRLLRQFQNIHILITSRIDNHPHLETYKIEHLDNTYANELFKHHFKGFKSEEQSLLDEILVAIGYNTLVIELLAKNLNEFNNDFKDHYPLKSLLKDIQQKGVLAISRSTAINSDYKLQFAKPEDIIRSMYDISHLSENEMCILSIYAVLPATAIPFDYLEQFLPHIEALDRVLIKLSQKGWIDYDKAFKSFKTNPIISEIARDQNKERLEDDTSSLLELLIIKLDYQTGIGHIEGDFNEIKEYVSFAETFVNNFDYLNYNKSLLFERLGNFYATYGNLDKALNYFEDETALFEELYESNPSHVGFKNGLAISYSKLGDTHTALGNLDKALNYFEDYLKLAKELYESNPSHVGFKNGLSISYAKLGDTHTALGNLDKALNYFEDDLKLTKELYESNPKHLVFKNSLAISYEKLGDTHTALGNLDKALNYFEDETVLFEELYESNPTHVDFINGLAISYSKLGDTHTALGNLDKALNYFEDDLKLTKELYESNPKHLDFKKGLAISYARLGETHTKLGNLDKALNYFEDYLKLTKELYESNPTHVDFKNGLAISYAKLGVLFLDKLNKKSKGINLLKMASDIYRELTDKHPKYEEFKRNYDWVIRKIKNVE